MTQPAMGEVEQSVGVKARFIVYYRRGGKPFWDASYAPTAEQAESDFLSMAAELGWHVEVDRVEERV